MGEIKSAQSTLYPQDSLQARRQVALAKQTGKKKAKKKKKKIEGKAAGRIG